MEIKIALITILRDRAVDVYAKAYAREAMYLSGEAFKTQCLYILNNLTHWRNPDAQEVRKCLKAYANG